MIGLGESCATLQNRNGDRWAARTSRSLLLAAGLAAWVAPDRTAYVAQAIALGRNPGTPARLAAMRARLLAAQVRDIAGPCRALEGIYFTTAHRASGGTPA
jgi:predicted O-linked N-acetylglucosamine transferase (SPINDLY family)